MAEIGLHGVTKRFGGVRAVDELTLTVGDGEFCVLLGPTGAGKTTTLRLIAGLEVPDSGSVTIGGEDTAGWTVAQRDVALVFQVLLALPALHRAAEPRLPAEVGGARLQGRRDRAPDRPGRVDPADRAPARPQGGQAVGRRDAARLDRPGDRARADRVPDGRAVVEPRRQAARDPALRAEGAADLARRHLPVRHPRSGRGDVDGRQDRRAERGAAGAGRAAERDLQQRRTTASWRASSARRR